MDAEGFGEVGFHGEYREIVPNERLVSTEVYEGIPDADEHAALERPDARRRSGTTDDSDHPGRAPDEGGSRRAHRVRHGGGHAGRDGSARGGRGLAPLNLRSETNLGNSEAPQLRGLACSRASSFDRSVELDDRAQSRRRSRRLPSNGIGFWSGCIRGSSIIFGMALSRVALSGHSTHEKMTVSSSLALTARRKSVTVPSGTSSPQHSSTLRRAQLDEHGVALLRVVDELLLVGRRYGRYESVDVRHRDSPPLVRWSRWACPTGLLAKRPP